MLGCAATSPGEPDWVQLWAVRQAILVHANGSHSNECAVKSLACQTDYKTQLRAGTFGRVCQPRPAIDGTMKGTGPRVKRFSEDRTSPYCNLARLLPWLTELPPDGVQVCDQSVQWRLVAASRDSSAWVHLGEKHRAHDQHYGHMMAWRWEVAGTRGAAPDGQVQTTLRGFVDTRPPDMASRTRRASPPGLERWPAAQPTCSDSSL